VTNNKNIDELNSEYIQCENRIKKIENDLKKPLDGDLEQNAQDEENREILNRLYRVETENLSRILKVIKSKSI
jgi:hypothetical protein